MHPPVERAMRKKPTPPNVLVTGDGPVTGEHYDQLQKKLDIEMVRFLARLGANVRDHYAIHEDLRAPIADPGLALHLRLIDRYPELVRKDPTLDELVQQIKAVKREYPQLRLPMRITPSLVGLLMGRHMRTSSLWYTGRTEPSWKIVELMRDFATLLDTLDDPAAFLEEFIEMVRAEAAARGEPDLFAARRWPSTRKKNAAGEDGENGEDDEDDENG